MRKLLLAIIALFYSGISIAQSPSEQFKDSAIFLLHKFQQNIGTEKYTVSKNDSSIEYHIDFKFVDRGSAVPLKAVLKLSNNLNPLGLTLKGRTSRMSTINDTVKVQDGKYWIRVDDSIFTRPVNSEVFPVAGYSPGTVQMLLIQYWKKHNRPANLETIPFGSVQIISDGTDTFSLNGNQMVLERYVIGGLIWGNELVWTDTQGQLICLITNDAEGDKLEMMLEPYESLLGEFITKSARYGMEAFAKNSQLKFDHPSTIVIKGATVVDVVNGKNISDAVVVIENGKIKSVGKASKSKFPSTAQIIEAKGKTVLPGLWDMHAHFEQSEWGPAYLAEGVTSVRDCGNEFEYINAIRKIIDDGIGVGPHILRAGIIDGKGPRGIGMIRADNEEEAKKQVQLYKENGFDQIKIYSSVKPEVVKAICSEAHRLGLTVTGHIPNGMNIKQGVDSGMDMVNHVEYVYSMMKVDKDKTIHFSDSSNQSVLSFLKNHKVVIDPTLGIYEFIFRSTSDDITKIEPAFSTLPLALQVLFKNVGMTPAQSNFYQPTLQNFKSIVNALHENGIQIVAGTDMMIPGYSLDRELELYVQAGLKPYDVIQASTIVPARVMKKDSDFGSVEKGKWADIIIVDGNPLENISDIRKISVIIKDGTIYDPVQLRRLVGFSR
ncbi:MAG: hypothetical protein C5B52_09670 [Bacteroidetes bacterium]|nr:MAG: hypothetical protein C5B52_09670 [Bacteroidota bacterium]